MVNASLSPNYPIDMRRTDCLHSVTFHHSLQDLQVASVFLNFKLSQVQFVSFETSPAFMTFSSNNQ